MSRVAWSSFGMGRCKELWGADAETLDPERFIREPNPSQFKYVSFNAGPRLCLGMNMAYTEAIVALTVLLHGFDFQLAVPENMIIYQNGLTLSMRNGLPVKVSRRH